MSKNDDKLNYVHELKLKDREAAKKKTEEKENSKVKLRPNSASGVLQSSSGYSRPSSGAGILTYN